AGNSGDYILQRKNHLIFKDVPGMLNNIVTVTDHIRQKLLVKNEPEIERKVITYLKSRSGDYFHRDEEGNYWTLFLFIRDSIGVECVLHPEQAASSGRAFGQFQAQLSDLDSNLLIETIPNFHNGVFRFSQLLEAVAEDRAKRTHAMQKVITALTERSSEMLQLQQWLNSGQIPKRITHNDTKINNVLFDAANNILCVIDLDTVMPGSVLFDFGDAIRTLCNTAAEDESDLGKIGFNSSFFKAFSRGYLSTAHEFLSPLEKSNLVFSCRYMVWEQTIRFLTDYLNGDTYYKISHPTHNLERTLAQMRYLELLEAHREEMERMVDAC
ncbi:MAG: aminoglycoside phosphotransferase family protein, partial [Marinilabiliales bacterium]|nr:aminoglycoside phosphotransferase family protein [Marinilabiliales bacterium]